MGFRVLSLMIAGKDSLFDLTRCASKVQKRCTLTTQPKQKVLVVKPSTVLPLNPNPEALT